MLCAGGALERGQPADMVGVRVRQNDVPNVLGLLAEFPDGLQYLAMACNILSALPGKPVSMRAQPSGESRKSVLTGPTEIA